MKRHLKWALLCGIGLVFSAVPVRAQTTATPQQSAFAAEGERTCLKCHDEQKVTPILQTPHSVKGDKHTPFGQNGCESCHGASPDHVSRKVKFPTVVFKGPNISPVAVRNEQCLSCHQSGLRMNWQGSQHQTNDVACTNCHTVHIAKDPVLVKFSQPEKCFTCHAEQRADSFKYSHHPIREGKVVCSDCHNPHGSAGPKLLKEFTVNETCYTCHAEKRGPLLWEHEPVRELSHPTRFDPGSPADPAAALPVPGVPCQRRSPDAALGRPEPGRPDRRQRPDDGSWLRELPFADPRFQ